MFSAVSNPVTGPTILAIGPYLHPVVPVETTFDNGEKRTYQLEGITTVQGYIP